MEKYEKEKEMKSDVEEFTDEEISIIEMLVKDDIYRFMYHYKNKRLIDELAKNEGR